MSDSQRKTVNVRSWRNAVGIILITSVNKAIKQSNMYFSHYAPKATYKAQKANISKSVLYTQSRIMSMIGARAQELKFDHLSQSEWIQTYIIN